MVELKCAGSGASCSVGGPTRSCNLELVDDATRGDAESLRRSFEIERELAQRLRDASKEERRSLYAEVYREFAERVDLPGNAEAQSAQVPLLVQILGPFLSGATSFLELGAGGCDLSLEMAKRMQRVWAVDAVAPDHLPDSIPESFRFVHSQELDAVVPESSVDVALSCHLVEHLHPEDLPDHLAEVLRLLVPGGVYVVVTPSRLYGPHDVSKHFTDRPVGFHLREYLHVDLAAQLARAGFARVGAIRALGTPPSRAALAAISVIERTVDALPSRCRRGLVARAPRAEPFRPLEQVKIAGFKPVTRTSC